MLHAGQAWRCIQQFGLLYTQGMWLNHPGGWADRQNLVSLTRSNYQHCNIVQRDYLGQKWLQITTVFPSLKMWYCQQKWQNLKYDIQDKIFFILLTPFSLWINITSYMYMYIDMETWWKNRNCKKIRFCKCSPKFCVCGKGVPRACVCQNMVRLPTPLKKTTGLRSV